MTDLCLSLEAYRKIFASQADEEVCWWYFGQVYADVPGWPRIPLMQTATIMVYRTETVSDRAVRIHYREVGYFRDPVTGVQADRWLNPVTGLVVEAAKTFVEGPSCYTVQQTPTGIGLSLEQAHAKVDGLDVVMTQHGNRILLTQNEYKSRGFPGVDGTMSAAVANGHTTLSFFASTDDLSSNQSSVPSTGAYRFTLNQLPSWTGFGDIAGSVTVLGVVHKAAPAEQVNPESWDVLRRNFPEFFKNNAVQPSWA